MFIRNKKEAVTYFILGKLMQIIPFKTLFHEHLLLQMYLTKTKIIKIRRLWE